MSVAVSILMGSDSDLDVMKECAEVLDDFGIKYDLNILSAHRTPALVAEFATNAKKDGKKVLICGAGSAAHLAGVVAAHTTLPVIGVPLSATSLNGFDALLSTVQMPAGIPVATVAVGKSGARNAAILAAQMIGISDEKMAEKLAQHKVSMAEKVQAKNEKLHASN